MFVLSFQKCRALKKTPKPPKNQTKILPKSQKNFDVYGVINNKHYFIRNK